MRKSDFYKRIQLVFFVCILVFGIPGKGFPQTTKLDKLQLKVEKKLKKWESPFSGWEHVGEITIDSFAILEQDSLLQFFFSKPLSYLPIRENNYLQTVQSLKKKLGKKFNQFEIQIFTDDQELSLLIPNIYRDELEKDETRKSKDISSRIPLVRPMESSLPEKGLYNKNIALWHSHGWYYEAKLDRWEWQRARLYQTVEDLFPLTYVLPYLTPMLENAGARVFLPRERDVQTNEIVVDNDGSTGNSLLELGVNDIERVSNTGFAWKDTLFDGENPFFMGSHLQFPASPEKSGTLNYIPNIPETGEYAVYISYIPNERNISNCQYTVYHSGGKSNFLINQKIGGRTWIYLGTFHFEAGRDLEKGSVRISPESDENGWITADAVKFGGGMGHVARRPSGELLSNKPSLQDRPNEKGEKNTELNPEDFQWKTSSRPRYMEGARYYLQYAGMPDTLVYSLNNEKNDYNDDYQSRGEWVNYLMGTPNGPTENRNVAGLGIPIDLSFAFHTDAGVTEDESIIGTLGIYSSERDDGIFPNGQSKMVNRDLTDIIQTQIVQDVQEQYNSNWTRRGLWNRQYSEAWRPNVPSMLLELLSHQNLADMSFGRDPRFRFSVSRAIYKGMLRFLAEQEDKDFVVQPLPVDHFSIALLDDKNIRLSWKSVSDPLEPSAAPEKYKVYKRTGKKGFDNGILVTDTSLVISLEEFNRIYSFKVTAVNEGGESFPSEILSVGVADNEKTPVLIINAFDRIGGQAVIDKPGIAGIAHWQDQGVPDKYDFGHTGAQYDFSRQSDWLDDDSPGWGASYGNMEGKRIPGNSFDFPYIHGEAILEAGYSFVSTSDETFCQTSFDITPYSIVDFIIGEEKGTSAFKDVSEMHYRIFTPKMRKKIEELTQQRANLFLSGAYIGSDHILAGDTLARNFAKQFLHFNWRTNHAVKEGALYSTDYAKNDFSGHWQFNTAWHPELYTVEAPDAIEPSGEGAITAFRYHENNSSGGILFKGDYKTVVLGFPFETILEKRQRNDLMKQVLDFFDSE